MRVLLFGDKAAAAKWVGFARSKVSSLPLTSKRSYNIAGVVVRIVKFEGLSTRIYITAGKSFGYQFVTPYEFYDFPTDDRMHATYFKYGGGSFGSPTDYLVRYEDATFRLKTPPSFGGYSVDGVANYCTWWGNDDEFYHVRTPQRRYGTGDQHGTSAYTNHAFYRPAAPVTYKTKRGQPVTITESNIQNFAIAAANVPIDVGGTRKVFVLWDTTETYLYVQQLDGSYVLFVMPLPSWTTSATTTFQPHNHYTFNRAGDKLACNASTYVADTNYAGRRVITGILEWAIELITVNSTLTPSMGIRVDEHDPTGFTRYIAIDYRWDDDETGRKETLVMVKVDTRLSDWKETTFGDYEYRYRMIAAFAKWYEHTGTGWEVTPYQTHQVFHGPLMHRIRRFDDPDWVVTYPEGMTPGNFGYGLLGGMGGVGFDTIADYHKATYGYVWKIGAIQALDLRADAYVISQAAKLDGAFNDFQDLSKYYRDWNYKAFGTEGSGFLEFSQLGGIMQSRGAAVPAYAEGGAYLPLDLLHPEAYREYLHAGADNTENTPSLMAVFNSVFNTVAILEANTMNTDFISIHPKGHWSAYVQYPRRWMYGGPIQIRNGFIGSDQNTRLFDTIRVRSSDQTYTESSHIDAARQLWGSTELVDGAIEVNVDGFLAMAAAGVWAV